MRVVLLTALLSALLAGVSCLPTSFDWRSRGMVSPVRDQGNRKDECTGVAITSLESYESTWAVAHGSLVTLSLTEILTCVKLRDCTRYTGVDNAVSAIDGFFIAGNKNGGLCANNSVPSNITTCPVKSCTAVAHFDGSNVFAGPHADNVLKQVAQNPVTVGVIASSTAFQTYTGGILTKGACDPTQMYDHLLLLIGWGTENGVDYWLLQNSWGTQWGEKGFVRIERGANVCAIESVMYWPTPAP